MGLLRVLGLAAALTFSVTISLDAKEIERLYRSAYHLGLGDTGVSYAGGYDALFYNPAGTADTENVLNQLVLFSPMVSVNVDAKNAYQTYQSTQDAVITAKEFTNKPQHIRVQNYGGLIFKKASLGFLQTAQLNAYVGPSLDAEKIGLPVVETHGFAATGMWLGFSHGFLERSLLVGLNLKVVHKAVAELSVNAFEIDSQFKNKDISEVMKDHTKRGTGVGGDLGFMYILGKKTVFRFGTTVRNVGALHYNWSVPSTASAPPSEPQLVDVGVSVAPQTRKSRWLFSLDMRDVLNELGESEFKRIHMGSELNFKDLFSLSVGMNQGYLTLGSMLSFKIFRFEAGYYTEELGKLPGDKPSNRVYGRVSVGWVP